MAGLSSTGLTVETIETLLASIVADQLANIDATLNTEADTLVGQLNAIYAAALLELWELFEEIYQAGYPDTASGQSLSFLAALTGTHREAATKGTVTARFHGADTTVVPAGTEFYIVGRPDSLFATIEETIIDGDTFADILCEAVVAGSETYGLAGESITMPNPPTGVTTPSNLAANSDLGVDEETDGALRIRREADLARAGSATVDSIRADLLAVTGVDKSQVYENSTEDPTDGNGLPLYAIECLVYSESAPAYEAQKVVDAIWAAKPAGTETYGSLSGTADDAAGEPHTVYYSEPTAITTHMLATLDYDPDTYIGDTEVQNHLAAWALNNLSMGDDVLASDIVVQVSGLAGVVSVDGSNTGANSSPVASGNPSLTISLRQVASVSTVDIDIDSTAV